jgi:hypothetical protein
MNTLMDDISWMIYSMFRNLEEHRTKKTLLRFTLINSSVLSGIPYNVGTDFVIVDTGTLKINVPFRSILTYREYLDEELTNAEADEEAII